MTNHRFKIMHEKPNNMTVARHVLANSSASSGLDFDFLRPDDPHTRDTSYYVWHSQEPNAVRTRWLVDFARASAYTHALELGCCIVAEVRADAWPLVTATNFESELVGCNALRIGNGSASLEPSLSLPPDSEADDNGLCVGNLARLILGEHVQWAPSVWMVDLAGSPIDAAGPEDDNLSIAALAKLVLGLPLRDIDADAGPEEPQLHGSAKAPKRRNKFRGTRRTRKLAELSSCPSD